MSGYLARFGGEEQMRRLMEQVRALNEQLKSQRAWAAQLQASLVIEQEKVRQLQAAFERRDDDVWMKTQAIETLKIELRAAATAAANLQGQLIAVRGPQNSLPHAAQPESPATPAGPPVELSAAANESIAQLQAALMDLENKLEQSLELVFDELNNRKAAEDRIRQLEAQIASLRKLFEPDGA